MKPHGYNVRFDHPLFTFRSTEVFGVDIHYRSELYAYMEKWLNSVLLLFTILVKSFSIQCFSITLSTITIESSASQCITDRLRTQFLTWIFAVDTMIASEYGDNICAARLVFRCNCPEHPLPALLPFRCPSTPTPHLSYPDSYNSVQFSVFTTRHMYSFPSVSLRSTPPIVPFIRCFATPGGILQVGLDLVIIDIAHPPPDLTLHPSSVDKSYRDNSYKLITRIRS